MAHSSLLKQNWFGASYNENENMESVELSMFCRACINDTNGTNSYSLDYTDSAATGGESLRQLLEKVMGIELEEVNEVDSTPTRICVDCYNRLIQFNAFRLECVQSNSALQKYLGRTVVERNVQSNGTLFIISEIKQEGNAITGLPMDDFHENYNNSTYTDEHQMDARMPDSAAANIQPTDFEIECFFGAMKDDAVFKCITCNNLTLNSVRSLYLHLDIHQPMRKNRICPFCRQKFISNAKLRRHLSTHSSKFDCFLLLFKCFRQ